MKHSKISLAECPVARINSLPLWSYLQSWCLTQPYELDSKIKSTNFGFESEISPPWSQNRLAQICTLRAYSVPICGARPLEIYSCATNAPQDPPWFFRISPRFLDRVVEAYHPNKVPASALFQSNNWIWIYDIALLIAAIVTSFWLGHLYLAQWEIGFTPNSIASRLQKDLPSAAYDNEFVAISNLADSLIVIQ